MNEWMNHPPVFPLAEDGGRHNEIKPEAAAARVAAAWSHVLRDV